MVSIMLHCCRPWDPSMLVTGSEVGRQSRSLECAGKGIGDMDNRTQDAFTNSLATHH